MSVMSNMASWLTQKIRLGSTKLKKVTTIKNCALGVEPNIKTEASSIDNGGLFNKSLKYMKHNCIAQQATHFVIPKRHPQGILLNLTKGFIF